MTVFTSRSGTAAQGSHTSSELSTRAQLSWQQLQHLPWSTAGDTNSPSQASSHRTSSAQWSNTTWSGQKRGQAKGDVGFSLSAHAIIKWSLCSALPFALLCSLKQENNSQHLCHKHGQGLHAALLEKPGAAATWKLFFTRGPTLQPPSHPSFSPSRLLPVQLPASLTQYLTAPPTR